MHVQPSCTNSFMPRALQPDLSPGRGPGGAGGTTPHWWPPWWGTLGSAAAAQGVQGAQNRAETAAANSSKPLELALHPRPTAISSRRSVGIIIQACRGGPIRPAGGRDQLPANGWSGVSYRRAGAAGRPLQVQPAAGAATAVVLVSGRPRKRTTQRGSIQRKTPVQRGRQCPGQPALSGGAGGARVGHASASLPPRLHLPALPLCQAGAQLHPGPAPAAAAAGDTAADAAPSRGYGRSPRSSAPGGSRRSALKARFAGASAVGAGQVGAAEGGQCVRSLQQARRLLLLGSRACLPRLQQLTCCVVVFPRLGRQQSGVCH